MEDAQLESQKDVEVAPALIAVHPFQHSVAVAVGSELRVFDLRRDCAVTLDQGIGDSHCKSLRAIRYGAKGMLFVSAGDDKLVKVWSTETWRCDTTVLSEKRVTAIAISEDGSYVCYADKFGVVWAFSLVNELSDETRPEPILSHYCSIITSLEFSPDGKYIISADRDFKIRVTVFPKNHVENGAHEIQSFCLGHTEFVTTLAFVCNLDLMVSGSGDSTVRMWDISSGSLLDTCDLGEKAGLSESNGVQPECHYAVTDICTIADGSLVAVAIQSVQGIVLLNCNVSARTLSFSKVVLIGGGTFIPTSIRMSNSTGLLWMVTGVSNLPDSKCGNLARVRAISISKKSESESDQSEALVLDDNKIPGATKLLEKLQGSLSYSEEAFLAAAEAVKTAMSNLLIKKHYTSENREFRKRTRNDKKTKK